MATLEIEIARFPNKCQNHVKPTHGLLKSVLTGLGYSGVWTLAMIRQTRKKGNIKFQLVKRKGGGIHIRIKYGGNDTAFDCILTPPPGHPVQAVMDDLRGVHPQNLITIPVIRNEPLDTGGIRITAPPTYEFDGDDNNNEETTPEPPIKAVSEITPELPEAPVKPSLALEPLRVIGLGNNGTALTHALCAISANLDHDGGVLRKLAISTIIDELDLNGFCEVHPQYNVPNKAAAVIIRGLVKLGWVSRWMYPCRNGSSPTTKGYLITPAGRDRLRGMRDLMPDPIQAKVFKPIQESNQVENGAILGKVQQRLGQLQPLLEEHDKLTTKIETLSNEQSQMESDNAGFRDSITAKSKEVDEAREMLELFETALTDENNNFERYKNEMVIGQQRLAEATNRLAEIKRQLSEIIG